MRIKIENLRLAAVIALLMVTWQLQAQFGSVAGKIMSADGQPVEFVNIGLQGTLLGTSTNSSGEYRINRIQPGEYSIIVSVVGMEPQTRRISISAAEITKADFTLNESALTLRDIIIRSEMVNPYYLPESSTIAKMPLSDLENPQVYQSVSSQLLKDQVVTDFNTALKNATGVTRLWESTGRGGDGAEYYSMRGFSVQPTMINGLPSLTNGVLDPVIVESIDVIKGPSGTLFGSPVVSYGGLINVTTKRPYDRFGGNFGFITGSFNLNRFTADINMPVNQEFSTRLNMAYQSRNSFQDAGFSKSFILAPSFTFKPTDKLTFLINTEILNRESANAPMFFLNRNVPLSFDNTDYFDALYERSFTSNDLTIENPTLSAQIQMLYDINDVWKSQTVISQSRAETSGYYHYFWDFGDGNTFGRYISRRSGETQSFDIQQNFTAQHTWGSIDNKLLVGLDYFRSNLLNASSGWTLNGTVTVQDGVDTGILTRNHVNELLSDSFEGTSNALSEVKSAYITNIMSPLPSLSILAGVRLDQFSGLTEYWIEETLESQTSLSPRLGIVYQPLKDRLSLFGNYQNGFVNIAPVQVADADGQNPRLQAFSPEQANQFEAGIKSRFFQDRLVATVSGYDITVNNRLYTDPENPNNTLQGGEVSSRGIEVSIAANPLDGLNLIAGFSDNDTKVTEDNPDSGYLGLRPEQSGPATLANFWASYRLQAGALKGLSIGFGGNYASEHLTLNRANIGTFVLPSYTVLNMAISYKIDNYDLIIKVNNLADRRYYSGWSTVSAQETRNISLAFSYAF